MAPHIHNAHLARPGGYPFAILSKHHPKADVVQAGHAPGGQGLDEARLLSPGKDGLKVGGLTHVCHIDQPLALLVLQAVPDGRHVRRGIPEPAVTLLHYEWWTLLLVLQPTRGVSSGDLH